MPLQRTGDLVASARERGVGVVAFNVITLEHAEAIAAGAESAGTPVILQVSQNAVRFHLGRIEPITAACRAVAAAVSVPVALHLDHVDDEELYRQAADAGFSSAMFDASRLDYEANVAATRAAVSWAHRRGLWLEAELGEVGGKEGVHAPTARTDPEEAAAFVAQTGVDALAVAVGSSHAMTTQTARLDFELVGRLCAAVPVPLVLHGSSGVADADLRRAVAAGLTKINIGTQLNVAFTGAVRATLEAAPELVDPRRYLTAARAAVSDTVERLLRAIARPEPGPSGAQGGRASGVARDGPP
jgi:fructose-bisphosphate aldolase class II